MRTKEEIVNCMKTLDIENSDIDVEVYKYLEWVLADDVGGNKMGKECIHLVVCRFINEKCIDGICNCWPTQYKADGVNVVLADVRAQILDKSFIIKNSSGNNLEQGYDVIEVKTVLSILSEHFR